MKEKLTGRRIRFPMAYLLPLILIGTLIWPLVARSLFPSGPR